MLRTVKGWLSKVKSWAKRETLLDYPAFFGQPIQEQQVTLSCKLLERYPANIKIRDINGTKYLAVPKKYCERHITGEQFTAELLARREGMSILFTQVMEENPVVKEN